MTAAMNIEQARRALRELIGLARRNEDRALFARAARAHDLAWTVGNLDALDPLDRLAVESLAELPAFLEWLAAREAGGNLPGVAVHRLAFCPCGACIGRMLKPVADRGRPPALCETCRRSADVARRGDRKRMKRAALVAAGRTARNTPRLRKRPACRPLP